ncbi:MAG: hypothetical protein Q8R57_14520, partial [Bacteroidota bacterium]|nr:hypothetical protein [Bacteroidota bacterium]
SKYHFYYVKTIPLFTYDGKNGFDIIDKNILPFDRITYSDMQYKLREYFLNELPNLIPVKFHFKNKKGEIFTTLFWFKNNEDFQLLIK